MTKPIQIRNEEVARDIRELAALTRRPITEAVATAVRTELARARRRENTEDRRREIDRLLAEFRALPKTGRMLTDDDLYDESGLPK
ncbi:type II toxin-antitoxin system VapB family antitoxin [Phenylobacterium sp.]|uniref:type II toxin-antitoxin system VapB family antitoxin n=1 Tax=Phenylobacterium sp. TaxID=1871053 RepID=UPI002DECA6D9|nr:type II toxin-antitoxin system VapB family antitoxin [Phenylobacterium sp.]